MCIRDRNMMEEKSDLSPLMLAFLQAHYSAGGEAPTSTKWGMEIDTYKEFAIGCTQKDEEFMTIHEIKNDDGIGEEQCVISYEEEGGIRITNGDHMKSRLYFQMCKPKNLGGIASSQICPWVN
eukprot:TRINITY_DN11860_c0_g1_i1.p1 TRINITY_DN11860_c0_g1~~TRINITY_DN11860_c0_g1_i1.p1  ORF type:complete len:134 (-),score=40.75 TRINITY_DN11860_c0_g1_i1:106-474(-)